MVISLVYFAGPAEAILNRAENFLDYLRCYICLKSYKCKPKEESKYYNISSKKKTYLGSKKVLQPKPALP